MNKQFFLLFLFLLYALIAYSQTYDVNKSNFDSREYIPLKSDVYSPSSCFWNSILIPGLGQINSNEPVRGVVFMIPWAAFELVYLSGISSELGVFVGSNTYRRGTAERIIIGGIGATLIGVFSAIDAIKVAKVNNMYYQSQNKKANVSLQINPYLEPLSINNQTVLPIGLSARFNW